MNKSAEMGVGTLIVFIAMLLVAAVAAGVLIQTVGSLQEKSLSTGAEAKGQIATSAEVVEISATDGRDTEVDQFEEIIKLAPGSNAMKIDDVIFTVNTYQKTASLTYRGVNGVHELNFSDGFNTRDIQELGQLTQTNQTLEEDLDEDGVLDTIGIHDATTVSIGLSNGLVINLTIDSGDMSAADSPIVLDNGAITASNGTNYGKLNISATTSGAYVIPASGSVKVTPTDEGTGYFTMEYLQEGTNFVNGNLQRGDLVKLYFESPGSIGESDSVRINFIPKIGTATLTEFVAPDVISTERVYLYP